MLAVMVSASTGSKQGNKKVTHLRPMVAAKAVQVLKRSEKYLITHRIHGAGIYANIGGILMVNVIIYSSTMDPMGYWLAGNLPSFMSGSVKSWPRIIKLTAMHSLS